MHGTDLNHEPKLRTFHVHTSAGGRRTRVYRTRPSRQVQLRQALAGLTGRRR
ncbi:hypothetical protein [Phytohabitans houttuyneae]|uniref:Uncharacterized protein n=1 Tax=Phytohabitans houttuyneae TaxID=1076126 RepID=A0A6V8KB86_9ACTN|nr:hypothetical protein [Phytohabitans houttuyneae]GFJ79429.1 hypothetical protein Phou_036090 [Phytohabitans houttuyneae]